MLWHTDYSASAEIGVSSTWFNHVNNAANMGVWGSGTTQGFTNDLGKSNKRRTIQPDSKLNLLLSSTHQEGLAMQYLLSKDEILFVAIVFLHRYFEEFLRLTQQPDVSGRELVRIESTMRATVLLSALTAMLAVSKAYPDRMASMMCGSVAGVFAVQWCTRRKAEGIARRQAYREKVESSFCPCLQSVGRGIS